MKCCPLRPASISHTFRKHQRSNDASVNWSRRNWNLFARFVYLSNTMFSWGTQIATQAFNVWISSNLRSIGTSKIIYSCSNIRGEKTKQNESGRQNWYFGPLNVYFLVITGYLVDWLWPQRKSNVDKENEIIESIGVMSSSQRCRSHICVFFRCTNDSE